MAYRVITQDVEINGTTYPVGAVLETSAFKPASGVLVLDDVTGKETPELSELDSLLRTKHVELVR